MYIITIRRRLYVSHVRTQYYYIKYSSIEKLQINNIYISKYLNELSDKTERLIL